MDRESNGTGSRLRIVSRTVFKCVFIDMSTPVMVPLMTVPKKSEVRIKVECNLKEYEDLPFLSSIVTLSLFSFIKKRTSFMIADVEEKRKLLDIACRAEILQETFSISILGR
jgi:hypothetical protein